MLTRRDFLRGTLAATAVGAAVPEIWGNAAQAATNDGVHHDRVLVVLQLAGGNDGLNTVVPYTDPSYYRLRPTVGVPADRVLHLDDGVGLHPALSGIKSMYDAGRVAVVRGAGYPNFTYSHFEAMRIYQQADPLHPPAGDGWLGRFLGQVPPAGSALEASALGEINVPGELHGPSTPVSVIGSAVGYDFTSRGRHAVQAQDAYRGTPGPYGAVFDTAMATAVSSVATVRAATTGYTPKAAYGSDPKKPTGLGRSLQLAAELIVGRTGAKVIHVVLGGFDDHAGQTTLHDKALGSFDAAVSGFFADLRAHGAASNVAMLTWSEFGRRPKENASAGTDHGSAQPMFLIGDPVRGGRLYGDEPSLTDLDNGNLRMTTDFRSVYQSVIADYLGADPGPVLKGSFPRLSLFR